LKLIRIIYLFVLLPFLMAPVFGQKPVEYPAGPDSKSQPGVPKGEVLKFAFENSKIFPGTWREYWVYVPAEYTPNNPACLYVNQDGLQWDAPTVFDNLIARKEMPVTIGVFVMHGKVRAGASETALDRFNRSYEYDSVNDNYARFLVEELLPDVETKKTSDGRAIRLSHSANDRAIGGSSSGAIAAFAAAWERPESFSRVFSAIGTYVGLRGGDRYPTLIRKYEPRPLRIFLQDGSNDLNIYGGDWWMANQTMERALVFAGYDVNHEFGEGAHSGNHGTAIFPDVMRWLWKDWPVPVRAGHSKNDMLNAILLPDEGWQIVGEGYGDARGAAAGLKGEVLFNDVQNVRRYKVADGGNAADFVSDAHGFGNQAFGPDGRLYVVQADLKRIVSYNNGGKPDVVATELTGSGIVVAHNGNVYVSNPPPANGYGPSRIWLIKPGGEKKAIETTAREATGLVLSTDQTLLYVCDSRSHWVYSYQIQHDGSLRFEQRYYWLHTPDLADDSGADGMAVDRDGRLYVATRLGIQVCDQAGRVNVILPTPNGRVSSLSFGGSDGDVLYAASGDKVYKRQTKAKGVLTFQAPIKPKAPGL